MEIKQTVIKKGMYWAAKLDIRCPECDIEVERQLVVEVGDDKKGGQWVEYVCLDCRCEHKVERIEK
jgi:DNA-directed RNA polymerase subunit RPC12/RpoP